MEISQPYTKILQNNVSIKQVIVEIIVFSYFFGSPFTSKQFLRLKTNDLITTVNFLAADEVLVGTSSGEIELKVSETFKRENCCFPVPYLRFCGRPIFKHSMH